MVMLIDNRFFFWFFLFFLFCFFCLFFFFYLFFVFSAVKIFLRHYVCIPEELKYILN